MKIRTKNDLIKQIQKIGEQKIEQGIYLKQLALSIKDREKQKTFKEWYIYVQDILKLKGGYFEDGTS